MDTSEERRRVLLVGKILTLKGDETRRKEMSLLRDGVRAEVEHAIITPKWESVSQIVEAMTDLLLRKLEEPWACGEVGCKREIYRADYCSTHE